MELVQFQPKPLANGIRERMLVNDWYFNPDTQPTATPNYLEYPWGNAVRYPMNPDVFMAKNAQNEWQFVWGTPESVTDLFGMPGQNVGNPLSLFRDHAVIKINGVYYDPSYGVTWASHEQWEAQAVAGFMFPAAVNGMFLIRENPTGWLEPADTEETLVNYPGGSLPDPP
jgi:hypothetical protein